MDLDPSPVRDLKDLESRLAQQQLPPVHQWYPQHCSKIDITIKADGSWWHEGSKIQRQRMVRLFSTILRLEDDGQYCLVTPAEKLIIEVIDAPFIAVGMSILHPATEQSRVVFQTNVGDTVLLDKEHELDVQEDQNGHPRPYVHVRDGLRALLNRSVYYDLVNASTVKNQQVLIRSCHLEHVIGSISDHAADADDHNT